MDILIVVGVSSFILLFCVFSIISCIQDVKRNRQKELFEERQLCMLCDMNAKLDCLSDYYETLLSYTLKKS